MKRDDAPIQPTCSMHGTDYRDNCPGCTLARQAGQAPSALVRAFDTGATRSSDAGRYDPEGFLSPIAIERYSIYMAKHQKQPDGSIRTSDNWQKGLPLATYVKGMWRHFLHLWTRHRGHQVQDPMAGTDIEEDLCALMFNVNGMLHEVVKARLTREAAGIPTPAVV